MLASCARSRLMRSGETARAAPALAVISKRRREIDPDLVVFLVIAPPLQFCLVLLAHPGADSPQGRQDNLWRQRNLGNYCAEWPQRIIDRVGHGRGGSRRPGFARAPGAPPRFQRWRRPVPDV